MTNPTLYKTLSTLQSVSTTRFITHSWFLWTKDGEHRGLPLVASPEARPSAKVQMLAALRSRADSSVALARRFPLVQTLGFPHPSRSSSSSANLGLLNLEEVEKILNDVRADDVKVIPVKEQCDWTDFMVIATGRSTWHVKNIAQALIHKVKQKQIGSDRMVLPSVEGHAAGNWIVVDSGTVIVHALDEKARAYYNLESLWTKDMSAKGKGSNQDLGEAFAKIRRKNNSKKKPMKSTT